jgi:hypothetical protein
MHVKAVHGLKGVVPVKRMVLLCCLIALVVCGALPAYAHTLSLVAAVSAQGNTLSVRLLDPYGAPLTGGTAVAFTVLPGAIGSKPFPLAEGPAGTYQGTVTPPGGTYELKVEATLGPDMFRLVLPNRQAGQDSAEQLVPMQPVEPQQGYDWGPVLYLGAVVVLVTATAVAMLRKRPVDDGAE